VNAKGQLERLLRIQELALATRDAQKVVDEAPTRLQEIEARFRERNAEYVAVKDQLDDVDLDQRTRSGELAGLEVQRDKYKASLMAVKNQREYAAMLKEIDSVNAEIAGHEEAILKDMEALETLREDLKTHAAHIKKEREIVDRESVEVTTAAATAEATSRRLTDERAAIEAELPVSLRATIEKLEARRQGVFLSKADNGTCMSCFVRVRPQMFQEIKLATAVHTCGNCRRFLYFAPSLPAEPTKKAEADINDGGVSDSAPSGAQAVNGGAV
jgi:predicted  nucleic acid-binding Zn-ribbon protein